ncbi:hypothetical protein HYFRA_00001638 [Hymenoscyphus fraxineus]|uniref:Uncharacterized protein n=1 Tax=Hymenoscyphus fraxineus TaxID=746836 RepID=A0A9N9L902_9HELO|nr:hypothetical protein HYFRA_00001638 [Hymenoscyphus fraxineus]
MPILAVIQLSWFGHQADTTITREIANASFERQSHEVRHNDSTAPLVPPMISLNNKRAPHPSSTLEPLQQTNPSSAHLPKSRKPNGVHTYPRFPFSTPLGSVPFPEVADALTPATTPLSTTDKADITTSRLPTCSEDPIIPDSEKNLHLSCHLDGQALQQLDHKNEHATTSQRNTKDVDWDICLEAILTSKQGRPVGPIDVKPNHPHTCSFYGHIGAQGNLSAQYVPYPIGGVNGAQHHNTADLAIVADCIKHSIAIGNGDNCISTAGLSNCLVLLLMQLMLGAIALQLGGVSRSPHHATQYLLRKSKTRQEQVTCVGNTTWSINLRQLWLHLSIPCGVETRNACSGEMTGMAEEADDDRGGGGGGG